MPTFSGRGECLYPLDKRVELDYLADRVGSRSSSTFNKLRRFVSLRRVIRDKSPDVIVSFLPHVNVVALLAACGLRIPVVVSERTYPAAMPLGAGLDRLRRFTYPRARAVVVQTQRALVWLERYSPRAVGRIIPNPVVYPLPCGEPVVEPASVVSDTRRVVLAVGRLGEEKGFVQLLAAFATLASMHVDWDLVVLGEGPERERLEAQRDRLGLGNRVHLPGRAGNPGDWYMRSDLYVMSSRFEGFPNTLLEAMAHAVPVVSLDCETGPADIIRDGCDGHLVPTAEGAVGLARAMDSLMRDENRRERMGRAAVSVRERFSSDSVMAAWDDVLGLQEAGPSG